MSVLKDKWFNLDGKEQGYNHVSPVLERVFFILGGNVENFSGKMSEKSPNKFALKAASEKLNEIRLSEPKSD